MKRKISKFKLSLLIIGLALVFTSVILMFHGYDILKESKAGSMGNMFSKTLDSLMYLLGGSLLLVFGIAFVYYSQMNGMFIYEEKSKSENEEF